MKSAKSKRRLNIAKAAIAGNACATSRPISPQHYHKFLAGEGEGQVNMLNPTVGRHGNQAEPDARKDHPEGDDMVAKAAQPWADQRGAQTCGDEHRGC